MVRNVMYRMGLDSELDDGVQDCFVKAWKGLQADGPASFSGNSGVKTWLMRIAVNTAIDYLRRRKRDQSVPVTDENLISLRPVTQPNAEASDLVRKVLQKLKPDSRAVLILSAIEGFTNEEIGTILDIPAGTVKSRMHAARKESEAELRRLGVQL